MQYLADILYHSTFICPSNAILVLSCAGGGGSGGGGPHVRAVLRALLLTGLESWRVEAS